MVRESAFDPPRLGWMLGAGLAAFPQTDSTWGLQPELVGYATFPITPAWSVRSVRGWVRGVTQPEMARGLGLTERDLGGSLELAVSDQAIVVPTLAIAGAMIRRTISLSAASDIDTSRSMLDHTELLPGLYGQLAVGLPVGRRFMLEPYMRFEWIPNDRRSRLAWGLDVSVMIGGRSRGVGAPDDRNTSR